MGDVRAVSIALSERFIAAVEASCSGEVTLASRRDPAHRGSQVAFRHREGYAVKRAQIARGVIGDFRAPDSRASDLRRCITGRDVHRAAAVLDGRT